MGKTLKNIMYGAGSLLDFTGGGATVLLNTRRNNLQTGIKRHTRGIKKHFDNAYLQLKK